MAAGRSGMLGFPWRRRIEGSSAEGMRLDCPPGLPATWKSRL
ncbi:hypothetical protein M2271_008182 [Streptomyces sp. LBL]|nr:hypothetical protein [Streptomyces sp. LBL]MDH6630322.1 hypothetical protein [Streptomyces sp. LBL]